MIVYLNSLVESLGSGDSLYSAQQQATKEMLQLMGVEVAAMATAKVVKEQEVGDQATSFINGYGLCR